MGRTMPESERLFAAACDAVRRVLACESYGDDLDGTLQAIRENLVDDPNAWKSLRGDPRT